MWALQIKYLRFRLALPEDLAWFPVLLFFKRRNKARWAPLRSTQICQHALPGGRYFFGFIIHLYIIFLKPFPGLQFDVISELNPADKNRFYWCFKESICGAKFCLYFFHLFPSADELSEARLGNVQLISDSPRLPTGQSWFVVKGLFQPAPVNLSFWEKLSTWFVLWFAKEHLGKLKKKNPAFFSQ